jgi:hypothetical protein
MRPLGLLFVFAGLSACAPVLPATLRYAWPPSVAEYTAVAEADGKENRFTVREVWQGPTQRGSWQVWQVESFVVDDSGIRSARVEQLGHGAAGWALLQVGGGGDEERRFEPPLTLLRGEVQVGDAWFAEHGSSLGPVTHGCEVLPYLGCERGVTSRCVTDFGSHRTVAERDFCPEGGLVAMRSSQVRDEQVIGELRTVGAIKATGERPKPPPPAKTK